MNVDEAAHTETDTHAPLKLGVSSDGWSELHPSVYDGPISMRRAPRL